MNTSNLATVFAPNLVHSAVGSRRPESVMSEIELNNIIVEKLIQNAKSILRDFILVSYPNKREDATTADSFISKGYKMAN